MACKRACGQASMSVYTMRCEHDVETNFLLSMWMAQKGRRKSIMSYTYTMTGKERVRVRERETAKNTHTKQYWTIFFKFSNNIHRKTRKQTSRPGTTRTGLIKNYEHLKIHQVSNFLILISRSSFKYLCVRVIITNFAWANKKKMWEKSPKNKGNKQRQQHQ